MIENIFDDKGVLLGIVVKKQDKKQCNDVNFVTNGKENIEVATMFRPKGYIKPHKHNLLKRETFGTQEFLYLKSGYLSVDFFDKENNFCKRVDLYSGDFVVLLRGGHGFELHKPCELIEVKNGPYLATKDKIYLDTQC